MFKYKSAWCPNKKDSHDSKSCVYAHHLRDLRRPPELFNYQPEDCETLVKGTGWDKCPNGILCGKCHTTVERLYHPDKYKRIFCDRSRCNKTDICAFYHTQKERTQANKECRAYRKACKPPALSVSELNAELQTYYSKMIAESAPPKEATGSKINVASEEFKPAGFVYRTPDKFASFSTSEYPPLS